MERTFVAIKPDGVQRGLVGEVISRLERRGLKLVAIRLMQVDEELAGRHYAEHVDRPFFSSLVSFITSGPIVAMIWEANNAVGSGAADHGIYQSRGGGARHYTGRFRDRHWPKHRSRLRWAGICGT